MSFRNALNFLFYLLELFDKKARVTGVISGARHPEITLQAKNT